MNSGGIENYIMNMYRNAVEDGVQFDFLVHHERRGHFDDEIEGLGGRIYRLPVLDTGNVVRYGRGLAGLFERGSWDVVHGHAASLAFWYLGAAERSGVCARIAHSHGASYLRTPKGYAKRVLFKGAKRHANVRLACSSEAGRYLFGDESFYLARNAIDAARFQFDEAARARTRSALGIADDDLLVGHVGRFNLQKNHAFLVRVFAELVRIEPSARLLLVGNGELRASIISEAERLGISDRVTFQDVTDAPEVFYAAMDVFVLPSLFEGLPLAGIEAQCSGLPCLFSSDVTSEVAISDLARFLDVGEGPSAWARRIAGLARPRDRGAYGSCPRACGFDSEENSRVMVDVYRALSEGRFDAIGSLLD